MSGADQDERRRNRVTLAMAAGLMVAIVAGGLVLAGRLLGTDDADDPSGTKAPASSTTTVDPKVAAERAYREFNAMTVRLGAAPDPDDPEIAERSTGITRTTFVKALTGLKERGTVL
ncbi:MAG TPA: hypothetical protein VKB57_23385, partial [Acidimicrobiales bacterium]|nr:hypothetical protein [Acidimicrobiales bacterium]